MTRIGRRTGALAAMALLVLASGAASPAEPQGRHITLADGDHPPVRLYYEDAGEGPPVLLLHGLGESTFTWHQIVPELVKRHRVLSLDLKGFGRSDKPADGAYTADDQARLVAQFLIAQNLKGVTVLGHSFGGTVALRTALRDGIRGTGRIGRLALIGAPALPRTAARRFDLVQIPLVPDTVAALVPADALARLLLREAMGGADAANETLVEGYAAPYREAGAMQAFLATARAIVAEDGRREIAQRYRRLDVPTLVVWCRKDPIVPLSSGRKLAAALPRARLTVMEGCHHLPQHERPEQLLKTLAPVLAR